MHSPHDFQRKHITHTHRCAHTFTICQTIPLCLVTPLLWFFFARNLSCPSKQGLWSIPSMLIAMAPLMMRQQTRPGRNISSARSQQTRSHLSLCSLGGSQAPTLLWPRGRENGSSIWFRETLASAVIPKPNNTSFFSRHLLQVNSEWVVMLNCLVHGVAEPRPSVSFTSHYITPNISHRGSLQPICLSAVQHNAAVKAVKGKKKKREQKTKVVITIYFYILVNILLLCIER